VLLNADVEVYLFEIEDVKCVNERERMKIVFRRVWCV